MRAVFQKLLRHKAVIIAAVVLLVATTIGVSMYRSKQVPANVGPTVNVERGDVVSMVSATGTISPLNMVDVSSKITGLIEAVKVNENDQVQVGQVLMVLDDTHLQAQVAQAQAQLDNAAGIYERSQSLEAHGAIATQALDTSRSNYNVAQAAYDDAVSQLNDTIIRAPISGQVIGKPIPAGQAVAPGVSTPMVLLTIADMSKMQIQTQVDESDIGQMQVGQNVTFTVDAYPGKTFTGVVSNVSQKATVVSSVVYYNVLVDVDAADNLLKPTMTARVSINVAESKNALVVPLAAVKANNGQQYVVIVEKNGKAQNTPVTTGLASEDQIEILSGLEEGDSIVVSQAKLSATSGGQGGGRGGGMIPGMGH